MTTGNSADTQQAIKSAEFVKSTVQPGQYPPATLPEVAFAGRSNVGKSSLINCLVQRKKLVRTSRTPGQTQTINFFLVNGDCYFVDLPGYGFARVPQRIRQEWGPMVETYLSKRATLRGIVQIMDARHPPTSTDLDLWHWLNSRNIEVIPVLTKADKISRSQWESSVKQASQSLGVPPERIILVSSVNRLGRDRLLLELWNILKPYPTSHQTKVLE